MAKVAAIAPHHRALEAPSALRELPGWLVWRYEASGAGKQLKVPYYVDGGRRVGKQGDPRDRARLVSFEDARATAAKRGFDGVGLAMLADWGITALDFDKCVDASGQMPLEVTQIVGRTYAEFSPSGQGVRAFVRGNLGNHKSTADATRFGFETFNSTGFVTFTGRVLPVVEMLDNQDTIADANDDVVALCQTRFGASSPGADPDDPFAGHEPRLGLTVEKMEACLDMLDPDMDRDGWIRVGMALHHECEGDDTGFELWNEWSSRGDKYPDEDALRTQWDSFTRRAGPGRRQVTMASVIKMAKDASGQSKGAADAEALKEVAASAEETPVSGVRTPDGFTGKYPVASAGAVSRRPDPEWLIHGVLPEADLAVLFGATGSGKSFAALDLAAAIARGEAWRGRRVKKGRVIIIAAEGGGGVGKRLRAYCDHYMLDIDTLDIGVITAAPNFLEKDEIGEVVASVVAAGRADLLIVDTFAQVTPGANENAGEDMGLALKNAKVLREVTGALVMLIHHAGKDATRGARGWSGIKAAADAEIEVLKHDSGAREMRISKMKDGDDGLSWGFKLDIVSLGTDKYGEPVTSCVAIECDVPPPAAPEKERSGARKIGRIEAHILDMIETVDPKLSSMGVEKFVTLCADGMPAPEEGVRDTRRQSVLRALKLLAKTKDAPISVEHGRVIFFK